MKTIHLEHHIDCPEDAFWRVFLDRAYNERLFREVLGFPNFEILDQREEDGIVRRECAAQPKLPAVQMALARLLRRRGFHFIERGAYEKAAGTWKWTLEPNVMAGLLRNQGTVRLEPAGPGKVKRIVDIELEARLPGIGAAIERSAVKRIEQGWRDSARFMNEWVKRN